MKSFISIICQGRWYDHNRVIGYSEGELKKIEKLYNIELSGVLRKFMLEAGRCSGGLLGDDVIILYNESFTVRDHILTQYSFEGDILNISLKTTPPTKDIFCRSPFLFSIESETQYFYINTRGANSERVFHFDENENILEDTHYGFTEYMQHLVRNYGSFEPDVICQGEILNI